MQYDMKPLFGKRDLRRVLEERQANLVHDVDQMSPESLLEADPERLTEALVASHSLLPVELNEDCISIDQADQKVDVSQDGQRFIRDRSGPFIVDATIVRFFVPFDGDAELFKYKPSTYSYNPPSGNVEGNELILAYATTDGNAATVKAEFERDLGNVRKYLDWAAANVRQAIVQLRSAAENRIAERRRKLLADYEMVSELGFPVRRRSDVPKTYVVPEIRRKAVLVSGAVTRGGRLRL